MLGGGTYGTCFLARYRDILVAVKDYKDNTDGSKTISELKRSLDKEAKIICKLGDHQGLALLFGVCSKEKTVYLVLLFHGTILTVY